MPDGTELERDTLNRCFTVDLNYNPNADWNVDLKVPYVVRTHSTYGDFDPQRPLPEPSVSHSSSLGDVKLIGSYQGFLPAHNLGLQLGVKLPTGDYGTAVDFNRGPQAGAPLDASLQPGTGSTDIILGAYYYRPISENFDVIVNGQFQSALADVPDTVGTVAYLSPGATAQLLPQLHVFGFVQVPVYSNLDGYQLFPRFTVSVGLSYAFGSG